MDIFWIVIGVIFLVIGILGCLLPLLPGPPLCFLALLLQQLKTVPTFTTQFILIMGGVTLVVTILDYVVPLYGTKKFGGTRYGIWGCTIGLVVGLWMGPLGIILGPLVGAFIGELIASNNSAKAGRAALGSFVGFLLGTLLKLITCLLMCWYFFTSL